MIKTIQTTYFLQFNYSFAVCFHQQAEVSAIAFNYFFKNVQLTPQNFCFWLAGYLSINL